MASVGTEQHHTGSRCEKERISTPVKFLRQNIGTNRVPPTQHSPVWKLERKYLTVTPGNKPHNHVVPHSFSLNSNNRVTTPAPTPPLAPRSGSTLYRFRSFHDVSVRTFDCQKPVTGHKPLDPKPKAADLRPYTSSFRDPAIKPVFKFSYRESAMATSMVDQPPLPSAPVEPKEIPVRSPSKIATKILSENSTLITNSFLRPSSAKVHFYPRVENKLVKSTPSHSSYHGHSVELVQSIGDEARLVCQTCTTAGTLSTNIQGVTAKWNPRTAWKLPEEENLDDSVQYQGAQLAEFVKKLTDKGDLLSTPSLPQLKAIPKHTFHKDSLYSVCKEKVPSALNPFGHQVNSSFPSLSSEMCLNERVDCTVPSVQQTETNLKAASPCASYQSTSCPLLDTNVPNGDCLPEVGKKVQGVNITVMATQISTIHLNKTSSAQETQVQPELLNDMASPLPNDQPDGAEEELPDDLDDSEVEEENEESTADQTTVLSAATSSSSIARQCDGTVEDTSPCSVNVKPALVPSLFPNLPPTIYFGTTDEKVESLPWAQRKLLKWKMSTVTPNIVKQTIARSHFRVTKKNHDWLGCWGHHMKSLAFKSIKEHQKLNHFPGSFQIGRKDRLWRNLSKMQLRFGKKEFNFFPQSFVLPQDIKILKKAWEEGGNRQKWIVKPPASARGMGIQVIHRWSQLPKKRPLLVQRYLHKPYLISGSKFDLRIYVYVTSFDPLRIYMFTDGLVRFASCKYSTSMKSLSNKFMHLTNYSVNKNNAEYQANGDQTACQGHKWALKALWNYLNEMGLNSDRIWEKIKDMVIKTIIASEPYVNSLVKMCVQNPYCCHELFGFDIMLDENLKPWVLEVNISPSLHSNSPLDISVKGQMIRDLLNLAGFVLPNKNESDGACNSSIGFRKDCAQPLEVLAEEKTKRMHYLSPKLPDKDLYSTVLDLLTPEDVRVLMETEDELSRCGHFERIFPSPTSSRYLRFFEQPRYLNILTNQWEQKYYTNRETGRDMLRSLYSVNYHCGTVQPAQAWILPKSPTRTDLHSNRPTKSELMNIGTLPPVADVYESHHPPDASEIPHLPHALSNVPESACVM